MQYIHKSQDRAFLDFAKEIASAIIHLQDQDKDGGIRGGPQVSWYSTEHNLDAYAFFDMLYKITKENLGYFSTEEFEKCYKVARNYGTRTLNIDSNSVFFWGILKDEN
jgi:hypothetical protein